MQNDVLKNEIAPWQEKGRWYHVHQTESGFDSANTDQFILDHCTTSASGTYWIFNDPKIKIVDFHFVIHDFEISTNSSYNPYNSRIRSTPQYDYNFCILKASDYTKLDAEYWLFINVE